MAGPRCLAVVRGGPLRLRTNRQRKSFGPRNGFDKCGTFEKHSRPGRKSKSRDGAVRCRRVVALALFPQKKVLRLSAHEPEMMCREPSDAKTPWKGTQIPGGPAYRALTCMEGCLGVPDILISGGGECTPDGRHQPGTVKGSRHCTNQAFDIPWYWIRTIDPKKLLCCAKDCGIGYAQDEGTHIHFQTTKGKNGRSGILPKDQDCICKS